MLKEKRRISESCKACYKESRILQLSRACPCEGSYLVSKTGQKSFKINTLPTMNYEFGGQSNDPRYLCLFLPYYSFFHHTLILLTSVNIA